MSEGFQLCPQCRGEYTLAVTTCAKCGVALVAPSQLPDEPVAEEMPPASELECVRVAPIPWIQALSGALEELGVAHRVEPATREDAPEGQNADFGDASLFGLYVAEAAVAAVRELDAQIEALMVPQEGEALAEGESDQCPACGSEIAADALECSDCGLPFA